MLDVSGRYAFAFLKSNLLCVLLAAVTGGVAHLIAATLAREVYEIAIGDRLLPGSPVESWLWGPLLIGAGVTWWAGFIAAPFVFLGGTRMPGRSPVRPVLTFFAFAVSGWDVAMARVATQSPPEGLEDLRTLPLLGLLDHGYPLLGLAFVALAVARWRGGAPERLVPLEDSSRRPVD